MDDWFLQSYGEETDQNSKDAMLDYLISLLDDANEFSWSSARANHAVLLCRMEQGESKDYTQIEQIDRVRCAYAQRHTPTDQDIQNNVSKVAKPYTSKSMVCQYYNSGTCSQRSTHEAKGVTYRHVCFFLLHKE